MFGVYAPMAYKLRFNPQKPRPKSLGFFLGQVPVYYICPPVPWGQAVSMIFLGYKPILLCKDELLIRILKGVENARRNNCLACVMLFVFCCDIHFSAFCRLDNPNALVKNLGLCFFQAQAKILGLFLGPVPVYYICLAQALDQAVSMIFLG